MSRKSLYLLLLALCLVGYAWVAFFYGNYEHETGGQFSVCMIKRATGFPCPSCGATRGVLLLLHGHIQDAIMTNPLSLLIALIMLCTPVWILYDLLKQKATLFEFYQKFEALLKKKQYAIPSILLIVANWGWNIYKDL